MNSERWETIGDAFLDDWDSQSHTNLTFNERSAFAYAWDIAWSVLTTMEEDDELRWVE